MPLTTILSLISTSVIFAGGVFGVLQLRLVTKQRARESVLQMVHSFRIAEFLHAVNIVFELPEGLTKSEIEIVNNKDLSITKKKNTYENQCKRTVRSEAESPYAV